MIGDVTMSTIEYALGGLGLRGDVRADNIANMNTPGFQASGVLFEATLADALAEDGDVTSLPRPAVEVKPGIPNEQGNTVMLESEMIEQIKDGIAFETFINSYNFKTGVLKTAISNGA